MRLLDKLERITFWVTPTCFWSGGDSTAQGAESSSASFMNTLQAAFGTQFANQSNTLNFLTGKMTNMVNNPTGYSPTALGAMRTSATDTVAQQFQNAKAAQQNVEFNRGGENLPSGVNAQINAGLTTSAAQTEASAQNEITQANANLENQNYWNASNALMGVTAQQNPLGYAGESSTAAGTVGNLSQAVTQANGPTIGAVLAGVGTGIASGWASGGFKTG